MAGEVGKASKPQLRGLLQSQIKKNIIAALLVATSAAIIQKLAYNDSQKKVYADFYKSYDIEKAFNQIRNKGLFDSCDAD